MGSRASAIGLLAALCALPSLALAEDAWKPTARLELDRGAETSCPDAQALTDAVLGRLGYDPFVATGGDLCISVHFAHTAEGVTGLVEAFDRDGVAKGEKRVSSKRGDCAEVAQAVTLTIAILLDPRTGLARPAPSKPEPDPLSPEPVIPDQPVAPPPPAPPAPPAFVSRVRAGIVGTVGAEPGPSIAGRAAFGVAAERWSLEAEFRGDLPRDATTSNKRATSGLLLGALVPCLRRGAFGACAVGAVGVLRSEVSSGSPPEVKTLHVALGPRASMTFPVGRIVAVVLDAEALFPLTRTTVRVDGVDVWSPPLVSGGLGIALEVRFP